MRIITSDNVAAFVQDGALQIEDGWTLADSAHEYQSRSVYARVIGTGTMETRRVLNIHRYADN